MERWSGPFAVNVKFANDKATRLRNRRLTDRQILRDLVAHVESRDADQLAIEQLLSGPNADLVAAVVHLIPLGIASKHIRELEAAGTDEIRQEVVDRHRVEYLALRDQSQDISGKAES